MKRFCLLLMAAVLLLTVVACAAEPSKGGTTSTTTTTPYIEPTLVSVSLSDMLPRELLSQLLDADMREPMVKENGTQMDAFSNPSEGERPVSIKINMIERTRTHYDEMLSNYDWAEQITEISGVGEVAHWVSVRTLYTPYTMLLFYAYGYAVEINLSSYDRTDSTLQTQATQVALTMIAALSKV